MKRIILCLLENDVFTSDNFNSAWIWTLTSDLYLSKFSVTNSVSQKVVSDNGVLVVYISQYNATAPTYFEYKHTDRSSVNNSSGICLLHIKTFLYLTMIIRRTLKGSYVTPWTVCSTNITEIKQTKLSTYSRPYRLRGKVVGLLFLWPQG